MSRSRVGSLNRFPARESVFALERTAKFAVLLAREISQCAALGWKYTCFALRLTYAFISYLLLSRRRGYLEHKRFEVRNQNGEEGFFLAEASSGFVTGPLSGSWSNDRVTVGLEENGDLRMVHGSIGPAEVWRHTPQTLEAEVDSFLANNLSRIAWADLSGPQTYLLSIYRRGAVASALFAPFEIPLMFIARHMVMRSNNDGSELVFERKKVEHFANSVRRSPLALLLKATSRLPPKVWLTVGRRIFKFFAVDPQDKRAVRDDICLLISPSRVGIVFASEGEDPSFITADSLMRLAGRVERSLPFGKLSAISNSMGPGTTFRVG